MADLHQCRPARFQASGDHLGHVPWLVHLPAPHTVYLLHLRTQRLLLLLVLVLLLLVQLHHV